MPRLRRTVSFCQIGNRHVNAPDLYEIEMRMEKKAHVAEYNVRLPSLSGLQHLCSQIAGAHFIEGVFSNLPPPKKTVSNFLVFITMFQLQSLYSFFFIIVVQISEMSYLYYSIYYSLYYAISCDKKKNDEDTF